MSSRTPPAVDERTPLAVDDPCYSPRETADYIHGNERTLERWRTTGEGPPFLKLGRRVVYRRSDLERWLAQQRRNHTGATPRVLTVLVVLVVALAPWWLMAAPAPAGLSPGVPARRDRPDVWGLQEGVEPGFSKKAVRLSSAGSSSRQSPAGAPGRPANGF